MLTLTTIIATSAATVASALIALSRVFGLRRVLKAAPVIDIGFTILLGVIFYGTVTGLLVATVGGLLMAMALTVLRGLERATRAAQDAAGVSPAADAAVAAVRRRLPTLKARKEPYVGTKRIEPSLYQDEYNSKGEWIYNCAPYM